MANTKKIKDYFLLHFIILMYSLGGIFSKLASNEKFITFSFICFYGMLLLVLLLYAILWQQILKVIPLTTAFANKSFTVIWGMVWGAILFNEEISFSMIIGSLIIFVGVYLVVNDNE